MSPTDIEIKKELANSVTHFLGVLFGIAAMPALITYAVIGSNESIVFGTSVFAFSFLMVFSFSTLYHGISFPPVKLFLRKMDHISIYFLIAGSYTPFILIYMFNWKGFILLSLHWGLTLLGIIFKMFFVGKYNIVSTIAYVAMGWLVLLFPKDLLGPMPDDVFMMVAIGGASYSIGVVFYLWERLVYHHAVWHLFVLGGSISHYFAVLFAVTS